jgi:hypothetical protein
MATIVPGRLMSSTSYNWRESKVFKVAGSANATVTKGECRSIDKRRNNDLPEKVKTASSLRDRALRMLVLWLKRLCIASPN